MRAEDVYAILNGRIRKVTEQIAGIATPIIYKGSVDTVENLPANPGIGWMYNIAKKSIYGEAGMNVAWTGTIWDTLGPIVDMSLYMTKEDGAKKLDKNQGAENSGMIMGINEDGESVPMFPMGITYDEETKHLKFGSDEKLNLGAGIQLDNTLSKTGYAADAGKTGEKITELKGDIDEINTTINGGVYTEDVNPEWTLGLIKDSGVDTSSTGAYRTGFNSLKNVKNINITNDTGAFRIWFYNSDKTFISYLPSGTYYWKGTYDLDISNFPEGTDYIRFTTYNLNIPTVTITIEHISDKSLLKMIESKVDKEEGKSLSSNDFTDERKNKVDNIPENPKYSDTIYDDSALKVKISELHSIINGTTYTEEITPEWILGSINDNNGENALSTGAYRADEYFDVRHIVDLKHGNGAVKVFAYDEYKSFIGNFPSGTYYWGNAEIPLETIKENGSAYIRFASYNSDIPEITITVEHEIDKGIFGMLERKVDKEEGKGLSSNDFTDEYKNIVKGMGAIEVESVFEPYKDYASVYHDEEDELIRKVFNNIDTHTLVFLLTTDNHYNEASTSGGQNQLETTVVYRKLAQKINCDMLLNLGDIIDEDKENMDNRIKRLTNMIQAFSASPIPFVYSLGHHELNPYSTSEGYARQRFSANRMIGLADKGSKWIKKVYSKDRQSFYVDFDVQKIRMICPNSCGNTICGFNQDTLDFVEETLRITSKTYKVFFAAHVPSDVRTGGGSGNSNKILRGEDFDAIVNEFIRSGGIVIGYFHGHTHFDNFVLESDMLFPQISTCCAKTENNDNTPSDIVCGNPNTHYGERTNLGTYHDFCADIVCIHSDTGHVDMYRFGVGDDRSFDLKDSLSPTGDSANCKITSNTTVANIDRYNTKIYNLSGISSIRLLNSGMVDYVFTNTSVTSGWSINNNTLGLDMVHIDADSDTVISIPSGATQLMISHIYTEGNILLNKTE